MSARRRTSQRPRRRLAAAAGTLAVLAVLVAGALGAFAGLERPTVDARFEARGTQPVDDIAVVAIDEHTFSSMNITWPMRRRLHAQMIERLRRAGVARVVYDVQFTEPSGSDTDDLALLDAVARTPGTILATGESDGQGRTRVLGGDAQLADLGSRAASSTFPTDPGGVIRRYAQQNARLDSLAVAVAAAERRAPQADRFAGGTALIDFRGPAGTVPTYSFADVLAGTVKPSALRGRVVVVGATAPVLQDIHATSAPGTRMMPGPEIQANAIWTALHGNPLQAPPSWVTLLATLLLGALGVGLVARFGPVRAPLLALLAAAGYAGLAVVAFDRGIVLEVAAPCAALLAGFGVASVVSVAGEVATRVYLARYSERLEREVQARTAALEASQLEVVLRLARAAELRDDDTGEHIDRMSSLCGEVARELGHDERYVALIRHAAALHDIGKIGVPDEILLKPGKLTTEEFAVMREHVVNGAQLLTGSTAPVLQLAEEIARTHHERWDGTGYPDGLAGEAIPIAGRIAAVCDVFDALSSERPYKRAWTPAEVRAEIVRSRGSHFDPRVADALLAVIDRRPVDLGQREDAGQRRAA